MARAQASGDDRQSLHERDFCLWLEQQAALLREGRFDEPDLANLIEEIDAMARGDKKAIKSDLPPQAPVPARAELQRLARLDRRARARVHRR